MEHSFRAAVFDLDGTLLDTLQDLGACADEALRQYGFPGTRWKNTGATSETAFRG